MRDKLAALPSSSDELHVLTRQPTCSYLISQRYERTNLGDKTMREGLLTDSLCQRRTQRTRAHGVVLWYCRSTEILLDPPHHLTHHHQPTPRAKNKNLYICLVRDAKVKNIFRKIQSLPSSTHGTRWKRQQSTISSYLLVWYCYIFRRYVELYCRCTCRTSFKGEFLRGRGEGGQRNTPGPTFDV